MLTSPANPTVEPEMQCLCPPGAGLLAPRMCGTAPDLEARLHDHCLDMLRWTTHFANAPLGVVASACTGTFDLIGAHARDARVALAQAVRLRGFRAPVSASPQGLTRRSSPRRSAGCCRPWAPRNSTVVRW